MKHLLSLLLLALGCCWSNDARGEDLRAGFDTELLPVQCTLPNGPENTQIELVVAALRRVDGRSIGEKLIQIAENWDSMLERLMLPSAV